MQSNEPEKKVVDDEIIATAAESVASESSVHSSVKELERKDSRDEMFGDQRMRKESQVTDLYGDIRQSAQSSTEIPHYVEISWDLEISWGRSSFFVYHF